MVRVIKWKVRRLRVDCNKDKQQRQREDSVGVALLIHTPYAVDHKIAATLHGHYSCCLTYKMVSGGLSIVCGRKESIKKMRQHGRYNTRVL